MMFRSTILYVPCQPKFFAAFTNTNFSLQLDGDFGVMQRIAAGTADINIEIWIASQGPGVYEHHVRTTQQVVDAGSLGVYARSGW
jgi:hypothetical protein